MKLERKLISNDYSELTWGFSVSSSSCDNPIYYKEFITLNAVSDARAGIALTHLFIDKTDYKLAGYIALRATSLISEAETGAMLVHPSLEIAELAVSKNYERKGVGKEMIEFAISVADELRKNYLGIKYIVVCSDPKAVDFYKKQGFADLSSLYRIPRNGSNDNCIPLYIQLPE